MTTHLRASIDVFPIAGKFTISRGSRTEQAVVSVEIERDGVIGRGECVPYPRYGETPAETVATIETMASLIAGGLDRQGLLKALKPSAARNGLDCALWDLEARERGLKVADMCGLKLPSHVTTAFTISLDRPEVMAEAARTAAHMPLLKLKLGAEGDAERLKAVRAAVPNARLLVDANEGWTADVLEPMLALSAQLGVELVEQPLPASNDWRLAEIDHPVLICADESAHALAGIDELVTRYDAINIKLDKTGGLTEALAVVERAQYLNMSIMVGCMVSSSLSMAPAALLAASARWVDLDGPLLLAQDRPGGLIYRDGVIDMAAMTLWGQ
ncbi:dipeptide epimerase [Devosia sp. WQ 349]|uniref:N-acetyl-D-Glu racemase DgcA n=1 Tax=Devosia sp. WQ 349K1 TaxID=2800329 RepID=UPI0019063DC1|nr:N-acetyl-D-Glu racemase DgcA [Devosia sp. WQ 349K1]MBK1794738.1 dipeptide epimerase [Devosia sp. WQ 349K1]